MSIRDKIQNNVFSLINRLTSRVAQVEHLVFLLQEKMDREFAIQRNHMVRIKNGEELSDSFLMSGKPYRDLTPHEAWKLFEQEDFDFIFLDVSHKDFQPMLDRPIEVKHIPLEELETRLDELRTKTTPLFIISEEGLRSVLACDFLTSKGFYNCNNVSGGWYHWPGHQEEQSLKQVKSA